MVFDLKAILDRLGGDEEILKEIAALFIEDVPEMLAQIRQAIASGDASALEKSAHALKGSVANFGAEAAVAAALRLEMLGRSGQVKGASEIYGELEPAMKEIQEALTRL